MKDIKILISSFLIIISFFVGYLYSEEKNKQFLFSEASALQYINISINKKGLKIDNQNKNVIILVNGEEVKINTEIKF